jgi:hypothetical protein
MRGRLQRFFSIVLVALAAQILSPVAACWAAAIAVSDPLQAAAICHDSGNSGPIDQGSDSRLHDGTCIICCVVPFGAPADASKTITVIVLDRNAQPVIWAEAAISRAPSRGGANTQARAPPKMT